MAPNLVAVVTGLFDGRRSRQRNRRRVYHSKGRPPGSTGVVTFRDAFIYEWVHGTIARLIGWQDIDEGRARAERLAEKRGKHVAEEC